MHLILDLKFVDFILSPCLQTNSCASPQRKSNPSLNRNSSSLPSQPTGSEQYSSHGSLGFFYTADSKSSASHSESQISENTSMKSINEPGSASSMNIPPNMSSNGNNNSISSFPVDENDNSNLVPDQNNFQHQGS